MGFLKYTFQRSSVSFYLHALHKRLLDNAIDEIELLGFPLYNVFELVDDDRQKYIPANEIEKHFKKEVNV